MHKDELGVTLSAQLASTILIGTNQFFFLCIHGNGWFSRLQLAPDGLIDMLELGVAIRVLGSFQLLFVALKTVAKFREFGQTMLITR